MTPKAITVTAPGLEIRVTDDPIFDLRLVGKIEDQTFDFGLMEVEAQELIEALKLIMAADEVLDRLGPKQ